MTFLMWGWPVVRAESLEGNALSNCSWDRVFARSTTLTFPNFRSLRSAINYAHSIINLQRYEEGKSLMRKWIPIARRILGDSHDLTLIGRGNYAAALHEDTGATLDDLRDAVTTLEEIEPIARRVLGGAHPTTVGIENNLRMARAALRAHKTPSPPPSPES